MEKKKKEEILTWEQEQKKLIEIAFKYGMYEKPAPKKYDDIMFTNFKDLLA